MIPRIKFKNLLRNRNIALSCVQLTIQTVATAPSFAWVVPAMTWLDILSFTEIYFRVLQPRSIENLHWFGLWLLQLRLSLDIIYTTTMRTIKCHLVTLLSYVKSANGCDTDFTI